LHDSFLQDHGFELIWYHLMHDWRISPLFHNHIQALAPQTELHLCGICAWHWPIGKPTEELNGTICLCGSDEIDESGAFVGQRLEIDGHVKEVITGHETQRIKEAPHALNCEFFGNASDDDGGGLGVRYSLLLGKAIV